jgi:hypothetical protein
MTSHTVSRELDKPDRKECGDPKQCWFDNINGFVARWNEPAGDIKRIISEAGFPDFFAFQETKATWTTIIAKCPGFLIWLETRGYNYTYCSWSIKSQDPERNLSGFAGILIISRVQPSRVIYGFSHCPDTGGDARLITAVFDNVVVTGCYALQTSSARGRKPEKSGTPTFSDTASTPSQPTPTSASSSVGTLTCYRRKTTSTEAPSAT